MYASLFRNLRLLYSGGIEKRRLLSDLEQSQWQSQEELEAQKLIQIQKLLKYAHENVPYYQNLFNRLDINPADVKCFNDFSSLPFLTKEMVMENQSELVSTKIDQRKLIPQQTGGSTGQPMCFLIDETFWWWAASLEERCRAWYGVQEGDKIAWIWGKQGNLRDDTFRTYIRSRIIRHRYLNALHLTPSGMDSFAKMLVHWQPDMFMAYTSSMVIFAQYVQENQIRGIHPRLIETTGEKIQPNQRRFLEEVFDCPVADRYGSREMAQIAFECPQSSMHISEGCHLELVENGKPVKPGEVGEVVLTCLHRFSMPFIRYKISDLAIASPKVCSCGRGLPVIQKIKGRTSDIIVKEGGEYIDESFFEFIFQCMPQIARYQIYQPVINHLHVRLVLHQKVDDNWINALLQKLQEPFGPRVKIEINIVDEIKQTASGKFRIVISDVRTGFLR